MADPTRPPAPDAHEKHGRLVSLANEYLSRTWATEPQILQYLERNCAHALYPITLHHVRAAMMTLSGRGDAEHAQFEGDRVLHWRRRQREYATSVHEVRS